MSFRGKPVSPDVDQTGGANLLLSAPVNAIPDARSPDTQSVNAITWVVPTFQVWEMRSVFASYVTVATAGGREVLLTVTFSGVGPDTIYEISSGIAQGPSTTIHYTFGQGLESLPTIGVSPFHRAVAIPSLPLLSGWKVTLTIAAGFQGGDAFASASPNVPRLGYVRLA